MSEITVEQIEENFADIHPAMSAPEAAFESNRCLYCYDAPCARACPTHIDVPKFIKKIASGNVNGAARVIFDANPIGASCARVCPVEVLCEGACVEKTLMAKPIEIGRLQRFATDHAMANGKILFEKGEANGKSVGIVGAGPAGLSCATYLARLGYEVTIYDRKPLPGGLDAYGMAEYKMTQSVAVQESRRVEELGVKFRLNAEIAVMPPPPALAGIGGTQLLDVASGVDLMTKHDAVFIGIGLGATRRLDIPGEDLHGVIDALHFIERVKTRDWMSVPLGRTVVVVGAGNTAIDAVTQAKRLGAERAILVYRKTAAEMPCYDYEYELAKSDGIEFQFNAAPIEIVGENAVTALRCRRTDGSNEVSTFHAIWSSRPSGKRSQKGFFELLDVLHDDAGRVAVSELMQTSNTKIFAGGDCVNGGAEAVDAAQAGKRAAAGIHEVPDRRESKLAGWTI